MIAITIRQPWAWCIAEADALTAIGAVPKLVENRGRNINQRHIGADVAIHAGTRWDTTGAADDRVLRAWRSYAAAVHPARPELVDDAGTLRPGPHLRTAAVVAVARLAFAHPARGCCTPWGDRRYRGGPAWHLVLDRVRRLPEPVPARGQLQVPWTLPEPAAEHIAHQLAVTA